jgi:hypothetical protein
VVISTSVPYHAQTIKEEWIGIYLFDDISILEVVFYTIKDYLSFCDNNEVFHILASFKLFQINPYLTTLKVVPHSAMVVH